MAQLEYTTLPFGAVGISGVGYPTWLLATTPPTSGTYNVGDVCFNAQPSAGEPLAWVCTVAGTTGGTWVATSQSLSSTTTTATSGTLTAGQRIILLNAAAGGTYSLPESANYSAGSQLTIKQLAAFSATLTPLATDSYNDGNSSAAITLTQGQSANLLSTGSTVWYAAGSPLPGSNTTTAVSGTLTNGQRLILMNAAAGGTYSLPTPVGNPPGFVVTIKQLANFSATLSPVTGTSYADAAAITLTQFQSVTLITSGGGSTFWYRAQ